jgi:Tol biopolymer transport system component/predicted Ser/Thr protein kinase
MIGSSLSQYRVTSKLGEGGMGEVWRAEDTKLGRDVALKMLPDGFAQDPERLARFEREARVLASLSHPNIAGIFGHEEVDGKRFLVMELVEGQSLAERIQQGPMPIDEVVRIAKQIAEAVEAAHDKGVVHRDLKPANVNITPDGNVKVLDFGLAKALVGDPMSGDPAAHDLSLSPTLTQAMTGLGVLLGTAGYMSPEQARGKPVDRRADIWAFGCIVYEMLTGQRLFSGETATDVIGAVVHKEPDLDQLTPKVPARIRRLLDRCLQKDVSRRLQSIGDARIALQEWLENPEDEVADVASPRPGWLPWAVAVVVGLIGLVLGGFFLGSGQQTAPPVQRFVVELGDEPPFTGRGAAVVPSPDGRYLAYATSVGGGGALYLRPFDRFESLKVAAGQSREWPHNAFFSPDSQWLGFFTVSELKKVPVTGGSPITLADTEMPRGGSWSADGRIVFAPKSTGGLSIVPAAGGEVVPLTTVPEGEGFESDRYPQWLPGDRAVLFTNINSEGPRIEIVDVESGERRVLHEGGFYGRYVPTGHVLFVDGDAVFALPFDAKRLERTGSPMPVLEGVASVPAGGQAQYAVSDTGMLVYRPGSDDLEPFRIAWSDRSGRIESLWDDEGIYGTPRLSPDGRRLAVSVQRGDDWDVWVYDIERDVATRLTFGGGYDADPTWSPDGLYVAFASDREGGKMATFRTRSDGTGEAELLIEPGKLEFPAPLSWSPDGSRLMVTTPGEGGSDDLWFVPADGKGEPEPYLASPFDESDGNFSPDGRWIAYRSNETGDSEIYVRSTRGPGKWQISDGGGWQPEWSGDGKTLFFRSREGLNAVGVEAAGDEFRAGRPEYLFGEIFGGPEGVRLPGYLFFDYDVSADGQQFVVFPRRTEQEAGSANVAVVTCWFEELRRLTGGGGR